MTDRFFDALPYPDRITVTRKAAGAQDPETGIYAPGGAALVLCSPCDVQDDRAGAFRDAQGDAYRASGARCLLPTTADIGPVHPGDKAAVAQGRMTRQARVAEVLCFQHALVVTWL